MASAGTAEVPHYTVSLDGLGCSYSSRGQRPLEAIMSRLGEGIPFPAAPEEEIELTSPAYGAPGSGETERQKALRQQRINRILGVTREVVTIGATVVGAIAGIKGLRAPKTPPARH